MIKEKDFLKKYLCMECGCTFIINKKFLEFSERKTPYCPYCGSRATGKVKMNYKESPVWKRK